MPDKNTSGFHRGGRGGKSRGHLLLALSHLTIDHASLSRRSTVPTPNRDTSNDWALITPFLHILHKNCSLILPPSWHRGWGVCTQFVHGRSRISIDPRISTLPGRSTSAFHQRGSHCLHPARSAVRWSASRMGEGGGGGHNRITPLINPNCCGIRRKKTTTNVS